MKSNFQFLICSGLVLALSGWLSAQPFWNTIGGPQGASVRAVTTLDNGVTLIATDAGIYRKSNEQPNAYIPWIPWRPWPGKIWSFQPGGGASVMACTDGGLLYSSDGGEKWAPMGLDLPVRSVLYYNDNLLAATSEGIYLSVGGGWQLFALNGTDVRVMLISQQGYLLAGTGHNIMRSTNGGATWSQVYATEYPVTSLVMNSQGHIFAGTIHYGVLRSNDDGSTWSQVNNGLCWKSC
jgi:hypothetical protein